MIRFILGFLTGSALLFVVFFVHSDFRTFLRKQLGFLPLLNPHAQTILQEPEKPLLRFSFPELSQTIFSPDIVDTSAPLQRESGYSWRIFSYVWEGKKITGVMTTPDPMPSTDMPTIIMIRGYIQPDLYQSGMGTRNGAAALARAGYIVLAPDFLGFGESDMPEPNVWWERFSKPAQILQLLASLPQVPHVDEQRVGIWGHSNGGQISLSVLEITQLTYPTVLWAPVSKPFPYSILQFTDTDPDEGQQMRGSIGALEWNYDVRQFSITQYFSSIKAPIQLHQGGEDYDVPASWSRDLVAALEKEEKDITYFYYPTSDHNLRPDWQTVMERTVTFYNERLQR